MKTEVLSRRRDSIRCGGNKKKYKIEMLEYGGDMFLRCGFGVFYDNAPWRCVLVRRING